MELEEGLLVLDLLLFEDLNLLPLIQLLAFDALLLLALRLDLPLEGRPALLDFLPLLPESLFQVLIFLELVSEFEPETLNLLLLFLVGLLLLQDLLLPPVELLLLLDELLLDDLVLELFLLVLRLQLFETARNIDDLHLELAN